MSLFSDNNSGDFILIEDDDFKPRSKAAKSRPPISHFGKTQTRQVKTKTPEIQDFEHFDALGGNLDDVDFGKLEALMPQETQSEVKGSMSPRSKSVLEKFDVFLAGPKRRGRPLKKATVETYDLETPTRQPLPFAFPDQETDKLLMGLTHEIRLGNVKNALHIVYCIFDQPATESRIFLYRTLNEIALSLVGPAHINLVAYVMTLDTRADVNQFAIRAWFLAASVKTSLMNGIAQYFKAMPIPEVTESEANFIAGSELTLKDSELRRIIFDFFPVISRSTKTRKQAKKHQKLAMRMILALYEKRADCFTFLYSMLNESEDHGILERTIAILLRLSRHWIPKWTLPDIIERYLKSDTNGYQSGLAVFIMLVFLLELTNVQVNGRFYAPPIENAVEYIMPRFRDKLPQLLKTSSLVNEDPEFHVDFPSIT